MLGGAQAVLDAVIKEKAAAIEAAIETACTAEREKAADALKQKLEEASAECAAVGPTPQAWGGGTVSQSLSLAALLRETRPGARSHQASHCRGIWTRVTLDKS